MPQLPDFTALGDRPQPVLPRRTPMVANYNATSGMESVPAQTLGQSGQSMEIAARVAQQMQEQQDSLRAEDAFNQLRQKQIDLTYGQNGYTNLKGGDAVNQPVLKNYGSQFDQTAQDLSGGLDNDFQRKLFQQRANIAGLELRQGIVRHISQQSDVYAQNVLSGTIATETNAAVADPSGTGVSLTRIINGVNTYASRFGLPKELADAKIAEAKSNLYSAQIKTAIVNDPTTAAAYYAIHANEISPNERPVLENMVKRATLPILAKTDAVKSIPPEVLGQVNSYLQTSGPDDLKNVAVATNAPLSVRQNNPGNITDPSTGQIRTFASPQEGEAALDSEVKLKLSGNSPAYKAKFGDAPVTPANLAETWSPAAAKGNSQASTTNYGKAIASALGIQPTDPIPNTPEAATAVKTAIRNFEAGGTGSNVIPVTFGQGGQGQTRDIQGLIGKIRANGYANAQATRPNDPEYADMVQQQITGRINMMIAAQNGVQRDAYGAALKIFMSNNPPKTKEEWDAIPGAKAVWESAGVDGQASITGLIQRQAMASAGLRTAGNQTLFNQVAQNIHKPDGDPNQITNDEQIFKYFGTQPDGSLGLSPEQYDWLKRERKATMENGPFMRSVDSFVKQAQMDMSRSIPGKVMAGADPNFLANATAQFRKDLGDKIEDYRNSTPPKDPRTLLDPTNKDSPRYPANFNTYLTPPTQAVAAAAAPAKVNGPAPVIAKQPASPKEGDESTSRSGKPIRFDGTKWVYKQ